MGHGLLHKYNFILYGHSPSTSSPWPYIFSDLPPNRRSTDFVVRQFVAPRRIVHWEQFWGIGSRPVPRVRPSSVFLTWQPPRCLAFQITQTGVIEQSLHLIFGRPTVMKSAFPQWGSGRSGSPWRHLETSMSLHVLALVVLGIAMLLAVAKFATRVPLMIGKKHHNQPTSGYRY